MDTYSPDNKARRKTLAAPGEPTPDDSDAAHAAELLRLAQEQMLVNQALVEKIFALEQTEKALQASEQRLHELLAHQLAIREDERKRISQELHDSLGQNLLALRIDIVLLHQQTTNRHYRLRDRICSALDNVDITLRTVKQLLGELRPPGLELGLHATVEMELRKFSRASGIACELGGDPAIAELLMCEEELLTVHGVLQECLNNVVRHSLASRVHVWLGACGSMLSMRILDNGIGFDPAAARKPTSFGLLDLHERATGQGGALVVQSTHTRGTEITLHLPIRPPQAN